MGLTRIHPKPNWDIEHPITFPTRSRTSGWVQLKADAWRATKCTGRFSSRPTHCSRCNTSSDCSSRSYLKVPPQYSRSNHHKSLQNKSTWRSDSSDAVQMSYVPLSSQNQARILHRLEHIFHYKRKAKAPQSVKDEISFQSSSNHHHRKDIHSQPARMSTLFTKNGHLATHSCLSRIDPASSVCYVSTGFQQSNDTATPRFLIATIHLAWPPNPHWSSWTHPSP